MNIYGDPFPAMAASLCGVVALLNVVRFGLLVFARVKGR